MSGGSIALGELPHVAELCARHRVRVTGLHAHVGSGILDAQNWSDVALFLAEMIELFPEVRHLDVGGGLGVPEKPDLSPSTSPPSTPPSPASAKRTRRYRYGSSRAASWWPKPACCSPG